MIARNKLWIALICTFLLCGCSKEAVPPKDITELDWGKISTEVDQVYISEKDYPKNISVNYSLDMDNSMFSLALIVQEGTSREEAVLYSTDVVKGINDLVSAQASFYEKSSSTSYGGFYKGLTLVVQVIPESPQTPVEDYLVDQIIPAGEYQEIIAK